MYEHTTSEFKEVVISDTEFYGNLRHNWPGYWSCLEALYEPGPCVFMGLDTVITGDLTPIFDALSMREVLAIRGWRKGNFSNQLLGWVEDLSWIPRAFNKIKKKFIPRESPTGVRYSCKTEFGVFRGDQDYLAYMLQQKPVGFWQDRVTGLYSYKHHIEGKELPDDARIVFFHGKPRPRDVGWLAPHQGKKELAT